MHGVSGTPPTEMLYTAPVTYDQGWDLAKVFEPNRDDWDVKAFHWGSLTSKSSLSAFWILLAPFAMANVAGWMSKVGILWDLGSFWPRWFHPLGPPAYGPYAVARMQTVITQEKPDVLAAHSQGSLIAAVALCLDPGDRAPGLFVTYGSQLGNLYPTLFPQSAWTFWSRR